MANICETKIGCCNPNNLRPIPFGSGFFHEISISTAFVPTPLKQESLIQLRLQFSKVESKNSITFGKNEYISEIKYGCNTFPMYLQFRTSRGRSIEAGDISNSGEIIKLKNIRLLAIRGEKNIDKVDSLTFTYICNYQPSVCLASNRSFILSFSPHFEEFEEISDPFEKNLDCYENIVAHMINRTLTVGVETEFVLAVSATLEINMNESSSNFYGLISLRLANLKEKLKRRNQSQSGEMQHGQNQKSSRKTIKVPEGYVAIKVVNGDLMKGEGGIFWMLPTSVPTNCILKLDEIEGMLDHYDLTGQLYNQMPKLSNYKMSKNGYVYYNKLRLPSSNNN